MFYILLVPPDCFGKSSDGNSSVEGCTPGSYYLMVYSIILGDFETDDFNTNLSLVLFVFFSVLVVIVLLNVLIAIISDSYEKCAVNSKGLFGRTRALLVAEIVSFQGLFRNLKDDSTGGCLKGFGLIRCTKGGFTFICLAALVVVVWIFAEIILSKFKDGEHGNPVHSIISILVNVFVLAIVLIALSRTQQSKSRSHIEFYASIQNITLRLLGTTTEDSSVQGHEVEEWAGKLIFLKNEISRTATETSDLTRVLMETELANSNRRMRRRILSLENKLQKSEENVLAQVQGSEERMHKMVKEYMKELCQTFD